MFPSPDSGLQEKKQFFCFLLITLSSEQGLGGRTSHPIVSPRSSSAHLLRMLRTESFRNMTRLPIITWQTSSWS